MLAFGCFFRRCDRQDASSGLADHWRLRSSGFCRAALCRLSTVFNCLGAFIRSGNAESLGLLRSFYAILTPPFGLYRAEQDSLKTSKRAKLPAW